VNIALRIRIFCLFAALVLPSVGSAQESTASIPFGPTSAGKEFYLSMPTNYEDPLATQHYIRLYITSAIQTRVEIQVEGLTKKTLTTVPYDVVTFDLTKSEAQAISRGNSDPVPDDTLLSNKAVHILADDPITVYVMNRASFTSDGMLALPVNGLGQEYIIASATDAISGFQDYLMPSQYVIVAPYDSTEVTIINAMNTPSHKAGDTVTITMAQGDVYSAMSGVHEGDLSGSYIRANRPVAVVAGENCTFLPDSRYYACDHLVEMMLPVNAWGKRYHSMPYATRLKGDLYRIFAGEDSAKVYINGVLLATLSKKGGPRGVGWIEFLPPSRGPMEFTSDKPIYVAQYNNSQDYDGVQTDPFYCVLTPVEQYQKEFVFTTPSNDFPKNYINLVCDSLAFREIEIAPGGTEQFKKLWQVYGEDVKAFKSQIDGLSYVGKTFTIDPGAYRIRGPRPFAAYIYGYSPYDSYGYPLSASVADKSVGDTIPPIINAEGGPSAGTLVMTIEGNIGTGTTTPLSTIDIDPAESFNCALEVDDFRPGVSWTVPARLSISDAESEARGVVVVCDMAGNCRRDTFEFSSVSGVPNDAESAVAVAPVVAPNPLSGEQGTVRYSLRREANVSLGLYDAAGHRVRTLIEERRIVPGAHEEIIATSGLSAGVYYCRMIVDGREYNLPITVVR